MHDGPLYTIPLPAEQGTGLGKALKIINHPVRSAIPIYVAALGEKNVEITAEIADGWLPLFFVPEKARDGVGRRARRGRREARPPTLGPLEICAGGLVAIGEDVEVGHVRTSPARRPRSTSAAWAPGQELLQRRSLQLRLRGGGGRDPGPLPRRQEAGGRGGGARRAARATNLVGPEGYVKERLAAFREAGVTVLNVMPIGPDPAEIVEKLKDWVS